MIHFATVHWRSDRWIDIQLRQLERFVGSPFRVYAFLTGVPGDRSDKFFYSCTEPIKQHATKLNILGDMISLAAVDSSDLLVFIDGDAFPLASFDHVMRLVERHRLVAVQRHENDGDKQPHPCFCATTVGFWQSVGGDWHKGYRWPDLQGHLVTDVGGNLLEILTRAEVDWYPLKRVNSVNAHPVLFGLYGDTEHGPLVYHHGAGFRPPVTRVDRVAQRRALEEITRLSDQIVSELAGNAYSWRRFA